MRHILFLLGLVLAAPALAASAPAAEGVYRSVMPDGKIVYGSKPEPGAKESAPVNLPPPNISAPTPRGAPPAGASKAQALDAATDEVRLAQNQLDAAKAALEAGREPRESERIGTAGGASRLTEDYDKRIKSLEAAVTAAQQRLDAALGRRNSAR